MDDVTQWNVASIRTQPMSRVLSSVVVVVAGALGFPGRAMHGQTAPFRVVESQIPELRTAMKAKAG